MAESYRYKNEKHLSSPPKYVVYYRDTLYLELLTRRVPPNMHTIATSIGLSRNIRYTQIIGQQFVYIKATEYVFFVTVRP